MERVNIDEVTPTWMSLMWLLARREPKASSIMGTRTLPIMVSAV
jgi:hypothetical protein